ncbi:DinB family protein [Paenibacillus sediminis]|uniref:Damage-inducible protein DinB n=1 Tax=Paenibacillus sediminis TaxID=664909 RepID=A0ABS4H349_9BACL|nr:DinB family protein [Paenibacillus sediminis]MBP1936550.1 putative damage-inducible protein DinB [Paenibacillus sediminis]
MKDQIIRTFDHVHWANVRILSALQAIEELPERTVRLFAHVLSSEKVWLTRLNERDSSHIPLWPSYYIEDCEQLVIENKEGYKLFIDGLTETDWLKYISYRNSSGTEFNTTILDILTHVSLHGSYHRGQISTYLRQDGFEPVSTDYINFVRQIETP